MRKKISTIFIAAITAINANSYIFANIFAAESECSNVATYTALQACLDANKDITLTDDIEESPTFFHAQKDTAITIDLNGHNITGFTSAPIDIFVIAAGTVTFTGTGIIGDYSQENTPLRIFGSDDKADTSYTTINIGPDIILAAHNDGIVIDYDSSHAYGIELNFAGTIFADNGIYVSENLTSRTNYPVINVLDDARISAMVGHPIIAGGYAGWNIGAAEFFGISGIGIKQGKISIDGVTVTARGSNNPTPTPITAGMNNSGAAIQIETILGRTDYSDLYITSGTFISQHGYSIVEYAGRTDDDSNLITLNSFQIHTGTFQGTEEFDGSVASTSTGALTWYFGDGTLAEDGSYFLETDEDYDSHRMTVARYANSVTGFDAIYANPNFDYIRRILPVFTPYENELYQDELDAIAEAGYENYRVADAFDITLRMFEEDMGYPSPGTSRPYTFLSDTGEDYPITFNFNLPEVEAPTKGYIRKYHVLNLRFNNLDWEYEVTELPTTVNSDNTYSFTAHKFSTFVLVYEDVVAPPLAPDTGRAD